jgi:outer membrane protein assembly factor BamB
MRSQRTKSRIVYCSSLLRLQGFLRVLAWLLIICGIAGISPVSFADEGNWPSFLGVGRKTGGSKSVPVDWSPSKHILWTSKLDGYGQSSPIAFGGQVYVTCVDGPNKQSNRILALGLKTGKVIWKHEMQTKNLVSNDDYHSRAAMSPVADANGVIAGFESGMVCALDHQGKVRWTKDLFGMYGDTETNHGISSSLAQDPSNVFVWIQRKTAPYLIALNKLDGSVTWKADRPSGISWGSPILLPMPDGSDQLVTSMMGRDGATGIVCGMRPADGEELWRVEGLSGNSSQTPCIVRPGEFLVGASTGRDAGSSKEAAASNGLVQVLFDGTHYSAKYLWRSQKATCGFCSPCFHNGHAYYSDKRGIFTCLDVATGEELFSEHLDEPIWATPLGVGPFVYFAGEKGTTFVFRADQPRKLVSKNRLWSDEPESEVAKFSAASEKSESSIESNGQRTENQSVQTRRQYAVIQVSDMLLIRSGDVLYAISSQ